MPDDVGLPKAELVARTLAREIRQRDATTPIMFLSAKAMKQDTIEGFRSGADDYMTKPFSPSELVARVKAHLARYDRLVSNSKNNNLQVGLDFNF